MQFFSIFPPPNLGDHELQCIMRFMHYYLMHYEIVNCSARQSSIALKISRVWGLASRLDQGLRIQMSSASLWHLQEDEKRQSTFGTQRGTRV